MCVCANLVMVFFCLRNVQNGQQGMVPVACWKVAAANFSDEEGSVTGGSSNKQRAASLRYSKRASSLRNSFASRA